MHSHLKLFGSPRGFLEFFCPGLRSSWKPITVVRGACVFDRFFHIYPTRASHTPAGSTGVTAHGCLCLKSLRISLCRTSGAQSSPATSMFTAVFQPLCFSLHDLTRLGGHCVTRRMTESAARPFRRQLQLHFHLHVQLALHLQVQLRVLLH